MRKQKKSPQRSTTTPAQFRGLFLAADAVAQRLLIDGGLNPLAETGGDGEDRYIERIREIVKAHIGKFTDSPVDDHMHYDEYYAHLQAAHMIGFALGRRLAGVEIEKLTAVRS